MPGPGPQAGLRVQARLRRQRRRRADLRPGHPDVLPGRRLSVKRGLHPRQVSEPVQFPREADAVLSREDVRRTRPPSGVRLPQELQPFPIDMPARQRLLPRTGLPKLSLRGPVRRV